MLERFGLALGSLLGMFPLFIVWLVGLVLSLVYWKKNPKVSLLTLISTAGFLVTSPVFTYLNTRMPLIMQERGLSATQLGARYAILGITHSLVSAGLWVLLLVAIFGFGSRQGLETGGQGNMTQKRLSRGGYWIRWLIAFPIGIVLSFISAGDSNPLKIFAVAASLAVSIYMIVQGVRRMHDVDKSGWFILVPIYNLVLALTDGTPGSNRFGEDPKNRGKEPEQKAGG